MSVAGPAAPSGKLFSGRIEIVEPDGRVSPYERFAITLNPDGGRTLRTVTRSPAGDLLRDVNLMTDADWRDVEAFGRLFFKGRAHGSILRRVVGDRLRSWLWKGDGEMDYAEFDAPPRMALGLHPVSGDAWKMNAVDPDLDADQPLVVHTVSDSWNGASLGHGLKIACTVRPMGREILASPLGPLDCERFLWRPRPGKDLHVWRTGEARMLAQMTVGTGERAGTVYRLCALDEEAIGPCC
ncbi:MAG TPA: hypothetical protein VL460_09960 [Caulobacteraceae bacterium]|jgi:hypothetical protein|nr:hypothetical protein [Caulobacteraceae bacterium]